MEWQKRWEPYRAKLCLRADWAEPRESIAEGLDDEIRRLAAERFQRLGLRHHAAIGTGTHLTLQLLRLGAPWSLVVSSQRSAAEQTRAAELCFGLAAGLGEAPAGPGTLAVSRRPAEATLSDTIVSTFLESSVGATVRAREAEYGASRAACQSIRDALTEMARGERARAALGWRTIEWGLGQDRRCAPQLVVAVRELIREVSEIIEVRAAAQARPPSGAIQAATSRISGVHVVGVEDWLLQVGLVPEGERLGLKRVALEDDVAPTLAGILNAAGIPGAMLIRHG